MNAKTKSILQKFDEPNCWETPSQFDYNQLKRKVEELVNSLNSFFKQDFEIDDQIQDASYYFDIMIPSELLYSPKPDLCISIRISNFGNLATLTFQNEYSWEVRQDLIRLIEAHHFTFMDEDDLMTPYDGILLAPNGNPNYNWFRRYFDYI